MLTRGKKRGRWAGKKKKKKTYQKGGGKKNKLAQHHLNNKAGVTLPQTGRRWARARLPLSTSRTKWQGLVTQ